MFYETMKNTMSLFIVETLHFNNYQRVVHEGVSSREAISKIFSINGVRIKITATMVFQLVEKINFNGKLHNISTEAYYFLIYIVSKPTHHPSGNVSGRRCDGNALNAEQRQKKNHQTAQILFVNLRTIHQPKS